MWFKETQALNETEGEVVMSLKRIVDTFGSVRPMNSVEKVEELNSGSVKFIDRIMGYKSNDK